MSVVNTKKDTSLIRGLNDYSGAASTYRKYNFGYLDTTESKARGFASNGRIEEYLGQTTFYNESQSGIQGLRNNQYVNLNSKRKQQLLPYINKPLNLKDTFIKAFGNTNPLAGSNMRLASMVGEGNTPTNFASVTKFPAVVFDRLLGRFLNPTDPNSIQYSIKLLNKQNTNVPDLRSNYRKNRRYFRGNSAVHQNMMMYGRYDRNHLPIRGRNLPAPYSVHMNGGIPEDRPRDFYFGNNGGGYSSDDDDSSDDDYGGNNFNTGPIQERDRTVMNGDISLASNEDSFGEQAQNGDEIELNPNVRARALGEAYNLVASGIDPLLYFEPSMIADSYFSGVIQDGPYSEEDIARLITSLQQFISDINDPQSPFSMSLSRRAIATVQAGSVATDEAPNSYEVNRLTPAFQRLNRFENTTLASTPAADRDRVRNQFFRTEITPIIRDSLTSPEVRDLVMEAYNSSIESIQNSQDRSDNQERSIPVSRSNLDGRDQYSSQDQALQAGEGQNEINLTSQTNPSAGGTNNRFIRQAYGPGYSEGRVLDTYNSRYTDHIEATPRTALATSIQSQRVYSNSIRRRLEPNSVDSNIMDISRRSNDEVYEFRTTAINLEAQFEISEEVSRANEDLQLAGQLNLMFHQAITDSPMETDIMTYENTNPTTPQSTNRGILSSGQTSVVDTNILVPNRNQKRKYNNEGDLTPSEPYTKVSAIGSSRRRGVHHRYLRPVTSEELRENQDRIEMMGEGTSNRRTSLQRARLFGNIINLLNRRKRKGTSHLKRDRKKPLVRAGRLNVSNLNTTGILGMNTSSLSDTSRQIQEQVRNQCCN
jgi:hypothetical protein